MGGPAHRHTIGTVERWCTLGCQHIQDVFDEQFMEQVRFAVHLRLFWALSQASQVTTAVFILSFFCGGGLLLLSASSLRWTNLRIWPPDELGTWKYHAFWWPFRALVLGTCMLSVIDYRSAGALPTPVFAIGWVLLVSGFGLAFYITRKLGWRDAHGEAGTLKTTGWYGWSRNPIYVVTICGLVGLALVTHSLSVYPLVTIWALLYLLAPFLEEPWLERHFGQQYEDYARQVPRFIGIPHREGK